MKLSNTLVFTTPWPRIKRLKTLINVVLLKPDKITEGDNKLFPSLSFKGNIEKKTKRVESINILFTTIDHLSKIYKKTVRTTKIILEYI